jgi:hypothetical protein
VDGTGVVALVQTRPSNTVGAFIHAMDRARVDAGIECSTQLRLFHLDGSFVGTLACEACTDAESSRLVGLDVARFRACLPWRASAEQGFYGVDSAR